MIRGRSAEVSGIRKENRSPAAAVMIGHTLEFAMIGNNKE